MDDRSIVELFWKRDEGALAECAARYSAYLMTVAGRILPGEADCEECVNDTLLRAWDAIPPAKPDILRLYLAKIARRLALDRWRREHAKKRVPSELFRALDELGEIAGGEEPFDALERDRLRDAVKTWLDGRAPETRVIFVLRYFYLESEKEIAARLGCGTGKVKSALFRCRKSLRETLEKEGFEL